MAELCVDTFWMKLYAMYRQFPVRDPHDDTVIGLSRDFYFVRQAGRINHEGVVANGAKGVIQTTKDAFAIMPYLAGFAVHWLNRPDDFTTKRLADGLMTETHP